jgi:hypothetical protein
MFTTPGVDADPDRHSKWENALMANGKFTIVATSNTPRSQLKAGISSMPGCAAAPYIEAQPEEGLRLVRAFTRISDRRERNKLIEYAEKLAGPQNP